MERTPIEAPQFRVGTGHIVWDVWAIELETAELLRGIARALKPDLVVESGTGRGIATRFLAEALEDNGRGRIVTFEDDPEFLAPAREILSGWDNVEVREGTSVDSDLVPDMVFVDCYGVIREPVITHWLTRPYRPLVVVHDANRPYPFHLGEGVHIPGHDGVWIGRAKETHG